MDTTNAFSNDHWFGEITHENIDSVSKRMYKLLRGKRFSVASRSFHDQSISLKTSQRLTDHHLEKGKGPSLGITVFTSNLAGGKYIRFEHLPYGERYEFGTKAGEVNKVTFRPFADKIQFLNDGIYITIVAQYEGDGDSYISIVLENDSDE